MGDRFINVKESRDYIVVVVVVVLKLMMMGPTVPLASFFRSRQGRTGI